MVWKIFRIPDRKTGRYVYKVLSVFGEPKQIDPYPIPAEALCAEHLKENIERILSDIKQDDSVYEINWTPTRCLIEQVSDKELLLDRLAATD